MRRGIAFGLMLGLLLALGPGVDASPQQASLPRRERASKPARTYWVRASIWKSQLVSASFGVAVRERCKYRLHVDPGENWLGCSNRVYSTKDLGATWTDITPDRWHGWWGVTSIQFLDSQVGWLVSASCDTSAGFVYRTTDGGTSWHRVPVLGPGCHAGSSVGVSFTDPLHGWMANTDPVAEAAYVSRTMDGGRTWSGPFGRGDVEHYPGVVVRLGPGRGWGTDALRNLLFSTGRFGAGHWIRQAVPAPSAGFADRDVELPTFFGPRRGLLPTVLLGGPNHGTAIEFLRTEDGGQNWSRAAHIDTGRTLRCCSGPAIDIVGRRTWWVTFQNGSNPAVIGRTSDGGETWQFLNHRRPVGRVDALDASTAWMTVWQDGRDRLLLTRDGGRTWTRLRPAAG